MNSEKRRYRCRFSENFINVFINRSLLNNEKERLHANIENFKKQRLDNLTLLSKRTKRSVPYTQYRRKSRRSEQFLGYKIPDKKLEKRRQGARIKVSAKPSAEKRVIDSADAATSPTLVSLSFDESAAELLKKRLTCATSRGVARSSTFHTSVSSPRHPRSAGEFLAGGRDSVRLSLSICLSFSFFLFRIRAFRCTLSWHLYRVMILMGSIYMCECISESRR